MSLFEHINLHSQRPLIKPLVYTINNDNQYQIMFAKSEEFILKLNTHFFPRKMTPQCNIII